MFWQGLQQEEGRDRNCRARGQVFGQPKGEDRAESEGGNTQELAGSGEYGFPRGSREGGLGGEEFEAGAFVCDREAATDSVESATVKDVVGANQAVDGLRRNAQALVQASSLELETLEIMVASGSLFLVVTHANGKIEDRIGDGLYLSSTRRWVSRP